MGMMCAYYSYNSVLQHFLANKRYKHFLANKRYILFLFLPNSSTFETLELRLLKDAPYISLFQYENGTKVYLQIYLYSSHNLAITYHTM